MTTVQQIANAELISPDELRLRPQTMHKHLMGWWRYECIAIWNRGYSDQCGLLLNKRSGAAWLVWSNAPMAQVVFQDRTFKTFLELARGKQS